MCWLYCFALGDASFLFFISLSQLFALRIGQWFEWGQLSSKVENEKNFKKREYLN